jgi:hypothetical protein
VEKVGGWDESLLAAQDEDFFISLALAGARVVYQPGSHSIYRRHGSGRITTSNRLRWLDNHCRVLGMAKETLSVSGKTKTDYQRALAHSYFALARNYYDIDRRKYGDLMEKVFALQPLFRPRESSLYNVTQRALGLGPAESRCGGRCRSGRSGPAARQSPAASGKIQIVGAFCRSSKLHNAMIPMTFQEQLVAASTTPGSDTCFTHKTWLPWVRSTSPSSRCASRKSAFWKEDHWQPDFLAAILRLMEQHREVRVTLARK